MLIIGKDKCSRCNMVKTVLDNKSINYEYILFEELSQEEQDSYLQLAKDSNQTSFPLIIKENKLITLQEV